jgi:SAM-dependent methyltransferase
MPEEAYWESLFDVPSILDALGISSCLGDVVELGCGFGTFSLPVAKRISGELVALDIDPAMVNRTAERVHAAGLTNIVSRQRDVMEAGFGLPLGSLDAVLLFNILHCESPETLLSHAAQVLRAGGHVLIIHWRFDARTPRGPDLSIRPRPEQVVAWAHADGMLRLDGAPIDLPPWHYGLRLTKLEMPAVRVDSSGRHATLPGCVDRPGDRRS